jgi:hypothetical protein
MRLNKMENKEKCKYDYNGNCDWSELGRKESKCIYSDNAIYDGKDKNGCIVRKILDSILEKKCI